MKRTHLAMIATALVAVLMLGMSATAMASNLSDAQSKYGVDSSRTITAKTPAAIKDGLDQAGKKASASKMWIVYAPKGSYKMPQKLDVPENVVFVAEAASKFTPATASNFTQFFTVRGSLYGGTYNCDGKAYYGLRYANADLGNGRNGWIERATVSKAKKAGIIAIGPKTRYAYAYRNTVTGCGTSGISAVEGAWMAVVNGNTVKGNGESGINVGHANMNIIKNNTISGNKGHGISTDVDGSGGHAYCRIHKIMGNTISGNGYNGVYIDRNCYVDTVFSRNAISSNSLNGLSIDAGGYVKAVAKNTIKNNKGSNVNVTGKKAAAYLGNSNVITGAGTNNVTIDKGAAVRIAGKGNQFNGAKNIGISINGGGSFAIESGKGNQVKSNGGFGIRVDGKSSCTISDMVFGGNGGFAVKVYSGSTIKQSNCGLSTEAGAKNRLYVESGAKVTSV